MRRRDLFPRSAIVERAVSLVAKGHDGVDAHGAARGNVRGPEGFGDQQDGDAHERVIVLNLLLDSKNGS